MISIVLVLLLILGINQVFTMTSRAVGAGAATGTITRDNRAAQATIFNDFRVMVSPKVDAPFFIIRSQREPAFRNRADELSDLDYDATETNGDNVDEMIRSRDLDADNTEDTGDASETPSVAIYDARNHRVDRMVFFARDLFRRQTGNDGTFVAPMSSTEAYIWYGHLRKPNFNIPAALQGYQHENPGIDYLATAFTNPLTAETNPENFYATDWILGRVVMLMREPDSGGVIEDNNGDPQFYIPASTTAGDMAPFVPPAKAADNMQVQWARYDLAGTSFAGYRQIIEDYIPAAPPEEYWYNATQFRYQGNPFPTRPHSSFGLARTVPVFLPSCTQFIIEYAGNFVAQDADGNVTMDYRDPTFVDSEIDYVIDWDDLNGDGNLDPGEPTVKRTRWYGLPRNTSTTDDVGGVVIRGFAAGVTAAQLIDVVPLSDVLEAANLGLTVPAPFERSVPAARANYANIGVPMEPNVPYTVAWGPDTADSPMPSMLRITLAIDDPNGRIDDAMTFEYVIQLP